MTEARAPRTSGKVRPARLTDLAALGELSRLCQSDGADTRSLGTAGGPRSACSACSAYRWARSARTTSCTSTSRTGGSRPRPRRARVVPRRVDDVGSMPSGWPMQATSATGSCGSSCAGRERGAARFHSPAPTPMAIELLMQAGFITLRRESDARPAMVGPCRRRSRTSVPSVRASDRSCARRTRPLAALRLGHAESGRSRPSGAGLGATGHSPRCPLEPGPGPAVRRCPGLRPVAPDGGRDGAGCAGSSDAGVAKEPAALPQGHREPMPTRLRWSGSGSGSSPRTWTASARHGHRTRANLRITDRSATGGRRLRFDRQRHAADEGNPCPRRRTGSRAGRRAVSVG